MCASNQFNGELLQEFFRFQQRVSLFEDRVPAYRARHRRDELDNRLVRQAYGILDDAAPKDLGCDPLLIGKSVVKPVD